jgi:hypothetical protein
MIWKHLGLPPPTPVQYQIADYLQYGPTRQIIEAFRGVGKSWITSAFVLWRLYCDPQQKFLVVSASKTRADDFSTFTLRLIKEVPLLQHLIPKNDQRESKIAFDVGPTQAAHAPSVKSVGIFGMMTGSRATHIIADDVENVQNSVTQDSREKLLKAVAEFEAIIVPTIGRVTYLGTPQTEESIYNKLRIKGYDIKIWPAKFPNVSEVYKYNNGLHPSITDLLDKHPEVSGKALDPKRFTLTDLDGREASYGRSGFSLQFMLDTTLSDAEKYPLKTSDIIVSNLSSELGPASISYGSGPLQILKDLQNVGFSGDKWYSPLFVDKDKWTEYEGSILAIDPAGRGTDEQAWCVLKQLHGKLFLLACGGMFGGYADDNLIALAKIAKAHQVNRILIESNFGDGMFTKIFTPVLVKYHPCTIEEVKNHIQKERRIIDTLEPVMNSHRLVVDEEVIKADIRQLSDKPYYSLFYQMTRITKERGALKHDDRIDVLAMAVNYFIESMSKDEVQSLKSHEEELFNKDLETFMDNIVIKPNNQRDTWV